MTTKAKPFIVTLKWLNASDACPAQVRLFERVFGESVTITPELAKKYGTKFDVDWLCEYTMKSHADYSKAWKAAQEATATLEEKLREIHDRYVYTKDGRYRERICWNALEKAQAPLRRKRDRIRRTVLWAHLLAMPRRQSRLPRQNESIYFL